MKFRKRDAVYITSLKESGVIVELPRKGLYGVAVGALVFQLPESDLIRLTDARKYPVGRQRPKPNPKPRGRKPASTVSIDLHGMRVHEAIEALEKKMDRALVAGADRIEIVHGIGAGKIMKAVHDYLARASFVKSYKLDGVNPGTTWAYF